MQYSLHSLQYKLPHVHMCRMAQDHDLRGRDRYLHRHIQTCCVCQDLPRRPTKFQLLYSIYSPVKFSSSVPSRTGHASNIKPKIAHIKEGRIGAYGSTSRVPAEPQTIKKPMIRRIIVSTPCVPQWHGLGTSWG